MDIKTIRQTANQYIKQLPNNLQWEATLHDDNEKATLNYGKFITIIYNLVNEKPEKICVYKQ